MKSLEALEEIKNRWAWHNPQHDLEDNFEYIEQELKALDIIKEHILYCENVNCFVFVNMTDEITNLLKEVLL